MANRLIDAVAAPERPDPAAVASSLRSLGAVSVPSLANQVAALMIDAIRSGIFALGSTLPNERDLAGSIGVSRKILRDALEALKAHGVIEAVRGRSGGNVVISLRGVSPLLREIYDGRPDALMDLHQVRRIVEREACRSAAERLSEADRLALLALLEAAETALEDFVVYQEYTVQFHVRVGMMSGNPILAGMVRTIANQISIAARGSENTLDLDTRRKNQKMLHGLVAAMHAKDFDRIDQQVDYHIDLIMGQVKRRRGE